MIKFINRVYTAEQGGREGGGGGVNDLTTIRPLCEFVIPKRLHHNTLGLAAHLSQYGPHHIKTTSVPLIYSN